MSLTQTMGPPEKAVLLILVGVLGSVVLVDAVKPRPVKRPKPINWNLSYYSGKFDMCKKLRVLNPVELVKSQAWAADVFRRCAPKLVATYATKYDFPAFGEYSHRVASLHFNCMISIRTIS